VLCELLFTSYFFFWPVINSSLPVMKSESESFDPLGAASPRLAQSFGLLCQELCFQQLVSISTAPDDPHGLDGQAKVAVGAGRMFVEGFVVLFRSLHHTALR
jgi:hypothetical protein